MRNSWAEQTVDFLFDGPNYTDGTSVFGFAWFPIWCLSMPLVLVLAVIITFEDMK